MTDQEREAALRRLQLDGIGWLELAGLFGYLTIAFGMAAIPLISDLRNEGTYSAASWRIGLAVGELIGLAAALGGWRAWRRRGGRRLMRLASQALTGGDLPVPLALRVALLREFERRDKSLQNQMPPIVIGVLWTVVLALRVAADHSVFSVTAALLIWAFFVSTTALNLVERRRWPRLRQLIAELRQNPYVNPSLGDTTQRSSTSP